MINVSYRIEDGDWIIALSEEGMEITMPLAEAQGLTRDLVSTFKEIIEIEEEA